MRFARGLIHETMEEQLCIRQKFIILLPEKNLRHTRPISDYILWNCSQGQRRIWWIIYRRTIKSALQIIHRLAQAESV